MIIIIIKLMSQFSWHAYIVQWLQIVEVLFFVNRRVYRWANRWRKIQSSINIRYGHIWWHSHCGWLQVEHYTVLPANLIKWEIGNAVVGDSLENIQIILRTPRLLKSKLKLWWSCKTVTKRFLLYFTGYIYDGLKGHS